MWRAHWLKLWIPLAVLSACGGSMDATTGGCREWLKQYEAAQRTAEKCMSGVATNCAVARPVASLDTKGAPFMCSDCQRHVDSSAAAQLDDLLMKYDQGGCAAGYARSCPECTTASTSTCKANGICG